MFQLVHLDKLANTFVCNTIKRLNLSIWHFIRPISTLILMKYK
jgi:hypothetical protein